MQQVLLEKPEENKDESKPLPPKTSVKRQRGDNRYELRNKMKPTRFIEKENESILSLKAVKCLSGLHVPCLENCIVRGNYDKAHIRKVISTVDAYWSAQASFVQLLQHLLEPFSATISLREMYAFECFLK